MAIAPANPAECHNMMPIERAMIPRKIGPHEGLEMAPTRDRMLADSQQVQRTIHVISDTLDVKALYYDPQQRELRPNLVFVGTDGNISFEINAAGLKGDPIDPQRKLAIVWGDSVVFSHGRGWPYLLDAFAPTYQFLNGGIEGDPYKNILRRAYGLNQQYPVALNLLMLGWHTFVPSWWSQKPRMSSIFRQRKRPPNGNEDLHRELTRFLQRVPNTVVLTVPTALNRQIVDQPLSSFLEDGDNDTAFQFFGDPEREVAGQREALDYILERNSIAREVCERRGARLVDLYERFNTEGETDFRAHFTDALHPRQRSYPLLAGSVHDGIKDLLI